MLVPFLIMLREGIEAALIVGIVAGYLHQTGRGEWMPYVWIGILLAAAMSLFAGAAIQLASAEFPQKAQELFEAIVGLVAVCVLTSMVFWMRRVARSIGASLRDSIDTALTSSRSQGVALVAMVFFAVAREGLESVFFLLATFQQSEGYASAVGAVSGLALAVLVGWGIYAGGVRLNLRRFFKWTGLFILFVAAGLFAGSVRALHEAGLWNHFQTVVFDLSERLPADSALGTVFSGLFGYNDTPTVSEVVAYLGFLLISLFVFLRPAPVARPLVSQP
ncbi:MAG: iron uptake transporter permease EfeU [Burkholderiaceae bacterium]